MTKTPPVRLFHVGQLVIVPATLENPYHAHRHPSPYTAGRQRVEALAEWRTTGKTPRGFVVWATPWQGHPARVTPADVDWTGSKIGVPADAAPVSHLVGSKQGRTDDARPKGLLDVEGGQ